MLLANSTFHARQAFPRSKYWTFRKTTKTNEKLSRPEIPRNLRCVRKKKKKILVLRAGHFRPTTGRQWKTIRTVVDTHECKINYWLAGISFMSSRYWISITRQCGGGGVGWRWAGPPQVREGVYGGVSVWGRVDVNDEWMSKWTGETGMRHSNCERVFMRYIEMGLGKCTTIRGNQGWGNR